MQTPFRGVPIPQEIHDQFPQEVKDAWAKFHSWWMSQGGSASSDSMPPDIKEAFEIMKDAPIPEHEGFFGRDSCYVHGIEQMFEMVALGD